MAGNTKVSGREEKRREESFRSVCVHGKFVCSERKEERQAGDKHR